MLWVSDGGELRRVCLRAALASPVHDSAEADEQNSRIEDCMTTEVHDALIAHRSKKAEGLPTKDEENAQEYKPLRRA